VMAVWPSKAVTDQWWCDLVRGEPSKMVAAVPSKTAVDLQESSVNAQGRAL
jgi:hypothetical protein